MSTQKLLLAFCMSLTLLIAAGLTDTPESLQGARIVIKNQGYLPFADAPIYYRSQDLNDPVAKLQQQMDSGAATLRFDSKYGYLKSVLAALHVPVSSQTLVFSKTSFQFPEISPSTPRALYFNDDVYVGHVSKGKFLEFAAFDPQKGAVFYVMDERQVEKPRFERAEVDCVQCHVAASTRNVPGVLMRSVFVKPSGYPAAGARSFVTGQESPMNERWGGWYVTARHGAGMAMGNALVTDPKSPETLNRPDVPNLTSLKDRFKSEDYLTGSSDAVALMVLAHQTQMHNLITQTSYQTRLALFAEGVENGGVSSSDSLPSVARAKFESPAEQLVRYLLFTNEAALPEPLAGVSGFTEEFANLGPRDALGRSLRDFDLQTRLFKYRCSYLIYSEDFEALPAPAKDYVYRRLFEVLSGHDQSAEFASLTPDNRRAILEILVSTKPGLPAAWKSFLLATRSPTKQNSNSFGNDLRAATGVANR
jgi:hypothetical protein